MYSIIRFDWRACNTSFLLYISKHDNNEHKTIVHDSDCTSLDTWGWVGDGMEMIPQLLVVIVMDWGDQDLIFHHGAKFDLLYLVTKADTG